MTVLGKYVLDASGQPQRVDDLMEWARWFEEIGEGRVVARTELPDEVIVSTVFLGMDHQWGGGPPLLFETMVFKGRWDESQWRWPTREAALAGHDRIAAAIRNGDAPDGCDS